jgi:hypothetical protein
MTNGLQVDEVCEGGSTTSLSDPAQISSFTVMSLQGTFQYYDRYIDVSPVCPSGMYSLTFVGSGVFYADGPGKIVPFRRNIYDDATFYMEMATWDYDDIFTIRSDGWQGTWAIGDRLLFEVEKVETDQYERVKYTFHACRKFIGTRYGAPVLTDNKCAGDMRKYTFCLCPTHQQDKCLCNYRVDDLHWYIVGNEEDLFGETWFFTWTNPETCCQNSALLSCNIHGPVYAEYSGSFIGGDQYVLRSLPGSPVVILPEDDTRWELFTVPAGEDGFVCDRLRWKLVYLASTYWYYYVNNHGVDHGGCPGGLVTLQGHFDDDQCSSPIVNLASVYLETVGLIGGQVETVVDYSTNIYIVNVKGVSTQIQARDFTRYQVGDWVAIEKTGATPPRGYPTVDRWMDDNNEWHDAVPYLTDQNVPKVGVNNRLVLFTSDTILLAGYYGVNYIGDTYLSNFAANDLLNAYVRIINGKGAGQPIRQIATVDNDKVYVSEDFEVLPDGTSQFEIESYGTYEDDNLRIIPYNFRHYSS